MHIPVVLGTARINRSSEMIARAVHDVVSQQRDVTTELVDVRDHVHQAATIPPWGDGGADTTPTAWKAIAEKAHAFMLVVPEYNHGYPGELKLLLDSLWDDYTNKPVGLVGVSSGSLGGARVVDHIKPVLIELKMVPIRDAVHISHAAEAVTEQGNFLEEKTIHYVESMVAALRKHA